MKFIFDTVPVAAFLIALVAYDIKVATAVLMVACLLQVMIFWMMFKRFERMHVITLVIVLIFGALTLSLNDTRFIKWKPTVVNWIFGAVLIGSQFVGRKPMIQRFLGTQLSLPNLQWRQLNMAWAIFFIALGLLNLYFAFQFRTEGDFSASMLGVVDDEATRDKIWGYFKFFGSLGLTLVFAVVSMLMVSRHIQIPESGTETSVPPGSDD